MAVPTIVVGYDASPGAQVALDRALVELADRHDARMIVVGSYGERPIKGAILGSTPHKLLHLAGRPVLVVPAG
jgi:nucleotide-binding universal stress UspA family protein